ncbi:hypothetical protein KMW28_12730 [Flammeovirga yaeyamensis]|uniref:Helicase/UvrB N-terminal domain-containing protein n=1 Tax=Flammeovirga yaeyamensis TaxID=367791 RepID=A0AAX1N3M3_9BACT|nr:hypothetical protein [Flammeovirga yaeyamensis]MBB3695966.1 hypothetical protein [Flammeovirga yaeyamensis]NMF34653.1 hypothetical protein [Flammeovirga yaeyamensis]QWG00518.1 hypothetical protein KMW28_12730 [Flammeovirga yaeyamensis]
MKELFIKFGSFISGLSIFPFPTGLGKTFFSLQYIIEEFVFNNKHSKKQIIFLTTLKKNLPYEELCEKIEQKYGEKGKEYCDDFVVHLKSNVDCVIGLLEGRIKIPKVEKEASLYLELEQCYKDYLRFKDSNIDDSAYKKQLEAQLSKAERNFRKDLSKRIKESFKNRTVSIDLLRNHERFSWVEEVYPQVKLKQAKVVFATIKKVFFSVDTIISGKHTFIVDSNLKDRLFIIDEFDSCKKDLLDLFIDIADRNANKGDVISRVNEVHSILNSKPYPVNLFGINQEALNNRFKKRYRSLVKRAKTYNKDYKLSFPYKFTEDNDQPKSFLFSDFTNETIAEPSEGEDTGFVRSYYQRHFRVKEKYNEVSIINEKPTDSKNLLLVLNNINKLLIQFSNFVYDLTEEYTNLNSEVSYDDAIYTVLDALHIDSQKREIQEYFIQLIEYYHIITPANNENLKLSLITKGFHYIDIFDNPSHNTRTVFKKVEAFFPELWLMKICENAMVIGMSATANISSSISNFAIPSLSAYLNEHFYQLDLFDEEIIRNSIYQKYKLFDKTKLNIKEINDTTSNLNNIINLNFKLRPHKTMVSSLSDQLEEIDIIRLINIAVIYYDFKVSNNINSFICFLNKGFNDSKYFNRHQLIKVIKAYLKEKGLKKSENEINKDIFFAIGPTYQKNIENVRKRAEMGEKAFLITTYNTMGAGQNIQYKIPEDINVYSINGLDYNNEEKDFDGCYLETPTYVINSLSGDNKVETKDLLQFLYETTYLFLFDGLSYTERYLRLLFGFKKNRNKYEKAPFNNKRKMFFINAINKIIIQAVGRLSRTNTKGIETKIYIDQSLIEYIGKFDISSMFLGKEYELLHQYCFEKLSWNSDSSHLKDININNTILSNEIIKKITYGSWDERYIQLYHELSDFILSNPTISQNKISNHRFAKFFIRNPQPSKVNSYSFFTDTDFSIHTKEHPLEISFDNKKSFEVSDLSARLDIIQKVPLLRDEFLNRKIPLVFTENDYILNPVAYRNIYLGRLGELAGQILLEKTLNIELLELPEEIFEVFDFRVNDDVYIDFKHWNTSYAVKATKERQRNFEKMNRVDAKVVLIINLINDDPNHRIIETAQGGKELIEIPGLLDNDGKLINSSFIKIQKYVN